ERPHHHPPPQRLQRHEDEPTRGREQERLERDVVDGRDQLALRDAEIRGDARRGGQPSAQSEERAEPEAAQSLLLRRRIEYRLAHSTPASSPSRRSVSGACGSERQASKHFPQFGPL